MMTTTILVVDDMAIFSEPIAASLRAAGYRTITAANGLEALELVRRERPGLIILDMAMPGMDGLKFIEILRSDPAFCETPIILLSARFEQEYVSRAAQLGIQDYVSKSSFSLRDLLNRVQTHLGSPAVRPPTGRPITVN